MADGQINVDLRLNLDKLMGDIRAAKAAMATGLSNASAQSADKGAVSQERMGDKIRKTTRAIQDQKKALDEWQRSLKSPVVSGIGFDPSRRRASGPDTWRTDAGGGLATSPPNLNQRARQKAGAGQVPPQMFSVAKPPVIPPPIIPGNAGIGLSGLLGRAGAIAAPIAAIGVALIAMKRAITQVIDTALMPLRFVARGVASAMEAARSLYAKSLQSGGGTGFTQNRLGLATVLGVSEQEVMALSAKFGRLNKELALSNYVLTRNNPVVAGLSHQFGVLLQDIKALWSAIAMSLAPAIRDLTNLADTMVRSLTAAIQTWGPILGKVLKAQLDAALVVAFGPAIAGAIENLRKMSGAASGAAAPSPAVSYGRLPASALEKMGLVVGSGGGQNYAQQTARNTAKTAEAVSILAQAMSMLGGGIKGLGGIGTMQSGFSKQSAGNSIAAP